MPDLLANPVALIQDVRTLVEQHRKDQSHLAVTGIPVISVPVTNGKSAQKKTIPPLKNSVAPTGCIKVEHSQASASFASPVVVKTEIKSEVDSSSSSVPADTTVIKSGTSPFPHLQNQLRQQQELVQKLRQPICVVRPALVGVSDPETHRRKASGVLLGC